MIFGFTVAVICVSVLAAVICITAGGLGKVPGDISVGSVALVQLLLIAQIVISLVAPLVGNPPTGSVLEFWSYLITAAFLPVAGIIWAFIDRTKWSTIIMGLVSIAVAVMMWRMEVIWTIQVA